MKKCLPLLCLLVLLCGCSSNNDLQQQATKIRAGLLKANSISFSGKVTASFPDEVFDSENNLQFHGEANNGLLPHYTFFCMTLSFSLLPTW